MDLLKTPSVQSLVDSDLESVESFQYLNIEELDEVEYALPTSAAPTLAEVLSAEDDVEEGLSPQDAEELATCSALQVEFLQAVSQQLTQAHERSSAGAATSLSMGKDGKLTVGTAHGHLLSFHDQILRWVCDSNTDRGAVSCLAYNGDSTRLLAGYARGLVCQYESARGAVLRRVTLGCEIWGTLRVAWAGTSALALDTGGSVWLMKFSRPLGVRSARTSCLFSGARGEVVAMAARDARVLALATLSRVIVVAGGRAAGARLAGPAGALPALEWCDSGARVLVCARGATLQWLAATVTGASISLRPLRRVELQSPALWLGWLGGALAIFDADENLRLWGDDYDKPLDLSHVEPVYASAFFKGVWTEGRVSQAMVSAGASAVGGACAAGGALAVLGRRGVVRARARAPLARAAALLAAGRPAPALRLLAAAAAAGPPARELAARLVADVAERPHLLADKRVADQTVELCLKHHLSEELWCTLWESCAEPAPALAEALAEAAARGDLAAAPPSPHHSQALIERLAEVEPALVERVLASLPLTSLDPHRASVFTRERRLWRGVGAIAAALGGACGAMRELVAHVEPACAARRGAGAACACAGGALLAAAADALAGRGAGGRALPDHARPSARRDALHALLADEPALGSCADPSQAPLRVLVAHDAAAVVRLLAQAARDPPFAGPLAKHNRLRVARALLAAAPHLQEQDDRVEVLEFISGQLASGALPADPGVAGAAVALAAGAPGERGDRAWAALAARGGREQLAAARARAAAASPARPRVLWRLDALLGRPEDALHQFLSIEAPSEADADELFEYLRARAAADGGGAAALLGPHLAALVRLRPRAAAALVADRLPEAAAAALGAAPSEAGLEFGGALLAAGRLRGAAAAAHLRALCSLRPADAAGFLAANPGLVRPEEALAAVRAAGPAAAAAEPACLEAAGDPGAALDALLRLAADAAAGGDAERESRLVEQACGVCARAAAAAPAAAAGELWARLLRAGGGGRARAPPPALLLDAAACLPLDELVERTCDSACAALALLECAASRRRAWRCAARAAGREAHEALARALRAARRGASVRGRCRRCGRRLAAPTAGTAAARTAHCARAFHAECAAEATCGACGRRVPDALYALPARAPPPPPPPPPDHNLQLVAPPRPDLEGLV